MRMKRYSIKIQKNDENFDSKAKNKCDQYFMITLWDLANQSLPEDAKMTLNFNH